MLRLDIRVRLSCRASGRLDLRSCCCNGGASGFLTNFNCVRYVALCFLRFGGDAWCGSGVINPKPWGGFVCFCRGLERRLAMAGPLPVKGTEISSAPCSVQRAAGVLRRFLSSEAASEVGIVKGYIEAVAQSLVEMLARRKDNSENGTEGLRLATAGRSSKFFNVEHVEKVPEIKERKSRKEKQLKQLKELKESKQKKKDQAMVDFEALLGHELDNAEVGERTDGELGFEEKPAVTEMIPSTPRQADSVDAGEESPKSETRKKKKRKSVNDAAMDVDMDGMQSTRKAKAVVDSDPDTTKSAKKKKKGKSVDGVVPNGLLSSVESPAKAIKVEEGVTLTENEDTKPADDGRKKKKKKAGATLMKESNEVLTEHMNSSVGDRGSNRNNSEDHQGSAKKKSKKRSSEESPENSKGQHRKSKKLRLFD